MIIKYRIIKIFKKAKIYLAYFKIKFLNEIQYKVPALAGVITQFAWGGMYIMLYSAFIYGHASEYTMPQMATFIWLQQAFLILFNVWSIDKDIYEQCTTGEIAMELIRPIDLYSIWYTKTLGKKLAMVLLRAIPILIICSMPFLGQYRMLMPINISSLILFIITLVLSVALIMAYIMIMYIVIMKNISSQGIRSAFRIVIEFLSGSAIPIVFMPKILVDVIKWTPFYYMQNVPFNIYNGYLKSIPEILKIIGIQLIWVFILTFIGKKMMKNQLNKIVVQGG